jgi:hypothetical protein
MEKMYCLLIKVLSSTAVRLYEAQNPREYTHTMTGGVVLCHSKGRYQIALVDLTVFVN